MIALARTLILAVFCLAATQLPVRAGTAPGIDLSAPPPHALCGLASRRIERAERIPAGLLRAIGRVESGRWLKAEGVSVAWPWTVYAEGKGRYLPSKRSAKRAILALRAKGVTNIDVGCMQINLGWHGDKFAGLDEVLDPTANTAYAGRFLASLKTETRTWSRAIARYHSRTPRYAEPYAAKVRAMWSKVKRETAEERRRQTARKWSARRQTHAIAARANGRARRQAHAVAARARRQAHAVANRANRPARWRIGR